MRSDETDLKGMATSAITSYTGNYDADRFDLEAVYTCNILHLEASVVSPRNANDCYNSLNTYRASSFVLHNTERSSA
jgi:hypothetical protein